MIPKEPDTKGAFNEVYDTLEELMAWMMANPKTFKGNTLWEREIFNANGVLEFYKKLRKEP